MHIFYEQMINDIEKAANYKLASVSNPMGGSAKNTHAPKVNSTRSVSNTEGKPIMNKAINDVIPEQSLGNAVGKVSNPLEQLAQNTESIQSPQLSSLNRNNGLFLPTI